MLAHEVIQAASWASPLAAGSAVVESEIKAGFCQTLISPGLNQCPLPEMRRPSDKTAMQLMGYLCSSNTITVLRAVTSHTLIDRSFEPEASRVSFSCGKSDKHVIQPECPSSV